jgi:hypothetical protein
MHKTKIKKLSAFTVLEEEFNKNLQEKSLKQNLMNITLQDHDSEAQGIQKLRIIHHHKKSKLDKVTQALLELLNDGLGEENEARVILHDLPMILGCSIGTIRSAVKRLQEAKIFDFNGQIPKLGVIVKRLKKVNTIDGQN